MRILHIAAHLGGGIGKAHAAIARELPRGVEQTFLLLEEPIDRRHADALARCGARVTVERDPGRIRALAHQADIVQLEYWGHPLLNKYAHLRFCAERQNRLLVSHLRPVPTLHAFLPRQSTGWCSPAIFRCRSCRGQFATGLLSSTAVSASLGMRSHSRLPRRKPAIAYLGTVDFKKLHRGIFDADRRLR